MTKTLGLAPADRVWPCARFRTLAMHQRMFLKAVCWSRRPPLRSCSAQFAWGIYFCGGLAPKKVDDVCLWNFGQGKRGFELVAQEAVLVDEAVKVLVRSASERQ